jgi:hypothetical protein
MSRCVVVTALILFLVGCAVDSSPVAAKWALSIHGGAGVIERASMTREREAEYRAALSAALETGAQILRGNGSALDAVESTIRLMEDDPLFNAGRGAVFTAAGRNELDASIMDGATSIRPFSSRKDDGRNWKKLLKNEVNQFRPDLLEHRSLKARARLNRREDMNSERLASSRWTPAAISQRVLQREAQLANGGGAWVIRRLSAPALSHPMNLARSPALAPESFSFA